MYLALLLKDGCKVGVSGGKLGVNIERFSVKIHRLVDVTLLSFNVGQVVEGIRVRRAHGQCRVVTFFRRGNLPLFLRLNCCNESALFKQPFVLGCQATITTYSHTSTTVCSLTFKAFAKLQ